LTNCEKRLLQPEAMAPYSTEYAAKEANDSERTPQKTKVVMEVATREQKASDQGLNLSDRSPIARRPPRDAPEIIV
jgi:hypothetical protein